MRVSRIIEIDKHCKQRERVELRTKNDNKKNEQVSFSEILNRKYKEMKSV